MIITGIPFDEKLNIGVLSKVFERKRISNCYKYFWFQAILENIVEDKFIEYVLYAGNYYGTSKESVFSMLNSGINVILALGYESAHKVKEAYHAAITVNILSSSGENLIAQKQNADIVLVNENPKDTAKQLVK